MEDILIVCQSQSKKYIDRFHDAVGAILTFGIQEVSPYRLENRF